MAHFHDGVQSTARPKWTQLQNTRASPPFPVGKEQHGQLLCLLCSFGHICRVLVMAFPSLWQIYLHPMMFPLEHKAEGALAPGNRPSQQVAAMTHPIAFVFISRSFIREPEETPALYEAAAHSWHTGCCCGTYLKATFNVSYFSGLHGYIWIFSYMEGWNYYSILVQFTPSMVNNTAQEWMRHFRYWSKREPRSLIVI